MKRITWHQRVTLSLGVLGLVLLCAGEPNPTQALPLGAFGDHTGENHAGENHAGEHLDGINLTGANLSGTNFSGAVLEGANLTNANLSGTNFKHAVMFDSRFDGAVLTPETNFKGVALPSMYVVDTDLRGARSFRRTVEFGGTFIRSNLSGLTLSGPNFFGFEFYDSILSHTDLRFSIDVNFAVNSDFTGADLRYASWMSEPELDNSDFSNVDLRFAVLEGGSFTNVNFTNADLRFARILGVIFTDVDFTNADLRFAQLIGDFTGVDFTGANIYGATIEPWDGTVSPDLTGAISDPSPTPEPGTLLLLGTGLIGLLGYGWRRRQQMA